MSHTEYRVLLDRVKRGTRHPDVLALCEAFEEVIGGGKILKGNFDKKKWQREYMKKYRERKRLEGYRVGYIKAEESQ